MKLPEQPVHFSKKEEKTNLKYQRIVSKGDSLLLQDKSIKSINRKLNKKKYTKIYKKIHAGKPFCFKMYPIFVYQDKILIMYSIISKPHGIPFIYEICDFKRD
jgi:hypothetical protein